MWCLYFMFNKILIYFKKILCIIQKAKKKYENCKKLFFKYFFNGNIVFLFF